MRVITLVVLMVSGVLVSSAEAKNCARGTCRGSLNMPVSCLTAGCTPATCCCGGQCQGSCPSANCQCTVPSTSAAASTAARSVTKPRRLSRWTR